MALASTQEDQNQDPIGPPGYGQSTEEPGIPWTWAKVK